jgi:hypothetical protein
VNGAPDGNLEIPGKAGPESNGDGDEILLASIGPHRPDNTGGPVRTLLADIYLPCESMTGGPFKLFSAPNAPLGDRPPLSITGGPPVIGDRPPLCITGGPLKSFTTPPPHMTGGPAIFFNTRSCPLLDDLPVHMTGGPVRWFNALYGPCNGGGLEKGTFHGN